jgi:phosphatidylglycerophosphate synthase
MIAGSTWRLPDTPLLTSAVATKMTALVGAALLAASARAGLPVSPLYAIKAPLALAVVMIVSIGFLQEHHPFARFGAANQITTVRALLVSLIVSLVGEPRTAAIAASAAGVSLAVTMLDGVDGWLARRLGTASAFGARFDMETDALLILALSMLAWRYEKAGAWVVASGALRYGFVVAGGLWRWLRAPLPPSRRRQAICVLQITCLIVVIVPAVVPPASTALAAVALLALTGSFVIDIVWLWRRAA